MAMKRIKAGVYRDQPNKALSVLGSMLGAVPQAVSMYYQGKEQAYIDEQRKKEKDLEDAIKQMAQDAIDEYADYDPDFMKQLTPGVNQSSVPSGLTQAPNMSMAKPSLLGKPSKQLSYDQALQTKARELGPGVGEQFVGDMQRMEDMSSKLQKLMAITGSPKALDAYMKFQDMILRRNAERYRTDVSDLRASLDRQNQFAMKVLGEKAARERAEIMASRPASGGQELTSLTTELNAIRKEIQGYEKENLPVPEDLETRALQLQTEVDSARKGSPVRPRTKSGAGSIAAGARKEIGPPTQQNVQVIAEKIKALIAQGVDPEDAKEQIRQEMQGE